MRRETISGDASIWLKGKWLPGEARDSMCAFLIWDLQIDDICKSQVYELRDLFLASSFGKIHGKCQHWNGDLGGM